MTTSLTKHSNSLAHEIGRGTFKCQPALQFSPVVLRIMSQPACYWSIDKT